MDESAKANKALARASGGVSKLRPAYCDMGENISCFKIQAKSSGLFPLAFFIV